MLYHVKKSKNTLRKIVMFIHWLLLLTTRIPALYVKKTPISVLKNNVLKFLIWNIWLVILLVIYRIWMSVLRSMIRVNVFDVMILMPGLTMVVLVPVLILCNWLRLIVVRLVWEVWNVGLQWPPQILMERPIFLIMLMVLIQ